MRKNLSQARLKALGGWQRKKTGCHEAPSYSAYYNLLARMDAAAFDAALCQWLNERQGRLPRDLAIDGKVLRGARDGLCLAGTQAGARLLVPGEIPGSAGYSLFIHSLEALGRG